MASYTHNVIDVCSSDEEEIDVNKMVETKQAVNKVYSDARFEIARRCSALVANPSLVLTLVISHPDQIRKDREKKRAQLQEGLDKKLADLRVRIRQTVEAHTQQLLAHPPPPSLLRPDSRGCIDD